MFGNLVESSSHKGDNARKGHFFLGTLAVYAVGFMAIAVGSIHAYNTHIETQNLELVSLITPVEAAEVERSLPRSTPPRPASGGDNQRAASIRTSVVAPTTDPTKVPVGVSTTPETAAPPTPGLPLLRGNRNEDVGGGPGGRGVNPFGGDGPVSRDINRDLGELVGDAPPPPPMEKKASKPSVVRSVGVVNGIAVHLPKPVYSAIARAAGAAGVVTVQVLIDERGKVVSARVLSGHPLLQRESVQAAYQARFTPTLLSKQPIKVSGVITYNFVKQ